MIISKYRAKIFKNLVLCVSKPDPKNNYPGTDEILIVSTENNSFANCMVHVRRLVGYRIIETAKNEDYYGTIIRNAQHSGFPSFH